jgi:hypothetical protein
MEPELEPAMVHKQSHTTKYGSLKDVIIIDSGSVMDTFMNPDFVTDIHVSKKPLLMSTNAGSKRINLEGNVMSYGKVYYDPDQLANIFGLASAIKKYRVTYDSDKEDAFLMHTKDNIVKFERTPEGLYAFKPTEDFLRQVAEWKQMEAPTAEPTVNLDTITDDQEGIDC